MRTLRYAWWTACAAAFLFITWLWVRGYTRWDSPYGNIPGVCHLQINSLSGSLFIGAREREPGSEPFWRWRTFRAQGDDNWGAKRRLGALGFGVATSTMNPGRTMHFVYMPYWFLAALAAAAPLVTRFSMRALLIATTVVTLLLGAVVYVVKS